ncbi:hypothetical protein ES703_35670 [subsurface metagenome]|nr:hypothetical protein [Dehalococcoidia bacterium]
MKILRVLCLLLVSLMAVSPLGSVFAQEEEYELTLTPSDGRYDTIIISGRDKDFRVDLENLGEEAVDKISFSGETPEGWTIKFDPPRLASLAAFDNERVYANINVPEGTAEGDYFVSLSASGEQASTEKIDIRVTVKILAKVETIEMRAIHPRIEAIAGADFVFEVEFKFAGEMLGESRSFELAPKAPQGWEAYMTPQFEKEKHISAIDLKPGGIAYTDKTRLVAKAPFWPLPEPGEYKIILEAVSGDLKDSLELTAVITATYNLLLAPAGERYNTTATAGRDNYFSIQVGNLGTAPIDKINFSSEKPEGWTIEFKPDKVDSLEALDTQSLDINIKPPPETIAGDYVIILRASGVQATSMEMALRVTVETPTIWGWVGIGIIVIVIIGLVVIFMRFSRR